MKKIFALSTLSILATLALSSCSKVSTDSPVPEEAQQEISFQTAYYEGQTKADEDSHKHLELETPFFVRAYYTGDTAWAGATLANSVLHMKDVEISKSGDVWKATTGTYYWPKAGKLSFFGYTGWAGTKNWGAEKTALFSSVETITNTSDPMVADLATDLSSNPTTATHFVPGVPMLFHHTAAKIAFQAKTSDEDDLGDGKGLLYVVKINSLSTSDMFTQGTYTLNATNATVSGDWSNPAEANPLSYLSSDQTLTTTAAALGTAGQVTVLPQSVADIKAVVNYTIEVYKKDGYTESSTPMATKAFENVEVSLATTSITAWEQNKIYTYTLIISPVDGEITFDPAVANWVAGGSADVNVNK